jgi:aminobenzoyl-glutamate utilization protein B
MVERAVLICAVSLLLGDVPVAVAGSEAARHAALGAADELQDLTEEIARGLWDLSETALREDRSAELLTRILAGEGFAVEEGVAGMPTAFVASWGAGRPVIGVLAEFDALPGVGNAAVPERAPREDGVTAGQGCGHNLFGAASVVGAIAARRALEELGLPGTIRLYGTPAEETVVGKVYMAREGVFDDLDAAIDWHPGTETGTRNQPGRAMNSFTVEYFGQAAHGARDPWNGRSALDAVELMDYGVNLMREHVKPTARIHYVITDGGDAPNVVPEYAKVWYYVRDTDRAAVQADYERVLKIAEGAALATETTHEVSLITGVHECLANRPLQEAVQANLELVGGPEYSEEEQDFARRLQRNLGIEEEGFVGTVVPLEDEVQPPEGGSTDVCEVSHIVPEVGFRVTTAAAGIPWHSWAATACHGTSAGIKGAVVASKVISLTAVDMVTDPELLAAAKRDFLERTEGRPYRSPIPADQPPPLP